MCLHKNLHRLEQTTYEALNDGPAKFHYLCGALKKPRQLYACGAFFHVNLLGLHDVKLHYIVCDSLITYLKMSNRYSTPTVASDVDELYGETELSVSSESPST